MSEEQVEFFSEYQEGNEDLEHQPETLVDSEREYPLETRCCITGGDVKHSFCRYPDPHEGTMMVMSREAMLKYSRKGYSLSDTFEQVLVMRRQHEKKG